MLMSGAGLEEILVYHFFVSELATGCLFGMFSVCQSRFVVSCMLDLVGDIRVFALNTVGTTPGSQELPGLPLARSWVEQPNKVSRREWVARNLPVIQLLLATLLHRYVLPYHLKCPQKCFTLVLHVLPILLVCWHLQSGLFMANVDRQARFPPKHEEEGRVACCGLYTSMVGQAHFT